MTNETNRIADQIRRAFSGDPWHGNPLSLLVDGLTAEQALARPMPSAHNVWELVLHIELWARIAHEAIQGTPMPRLYGTGKDWTGITIGDELAWTKAAQAMLATGAAFADAVAKFPDERLGDTVPGRDYNFYYLFHGIVQHSLYHGGQIAMLKSALAG